MITGSLVALVTPMHDDGSVDWDSLHKLVEFQVQEGTDGIVAVGTTGESATLRCNEQSEVIRRIVEQVNGRVAVIGGTGANATQEAIELTAEAKRLGVDACLLVTPYYNKPTQEGLYLHYKAIADAVDIPQILYNVPGRTAVDLLPETVACLAGHKNIVGIKEATGIVERGSLIRQLCGDAFAIYSGDDATSMELMLQGADGAISVTNNIVPKQMAELCAAATSGDRQTAERINNQLDVLHRKLFLEANPIPVKWALFEMERIEKGIRLPLTPLSESCRIELHDALKQAKLI